MAIPGWSVAAAVLILEDAALHYRTLTSAVMDSGLSNLGGRGGSTPWQTLRVDININHADIFQAHGGRSGYYQIGDLPRALGIHSVRQAIWRLASKRFEEYQDLIREVIVLQRNLMKWPSYKEKVIEFENLFHRLSFLHTKNGR